MRAKRAFDGRKLEKRDDDACFSHALAFLLGLPSDKVPIFHRANDKGGQALLERAAAWCAERGLALILHPVPDRADVLDQVNAINGGRPFLLMGLSGDNAEGHDKRNGQPIGHTVVVHGRRVVCDPGELGLAGPGPAGHYWVGLVENLPPLAPSPRPTLPTPGDLLGVRHRA